MVATLLVGCLNSLTVRPVDSGTRKPARVDVLFQVTARGEPVLGLTDDNATVMEGNQEVAKGRSWALYNPDMRSRMHVALLIDLGDSPTASQRAELAAAAQRFVDKLAGGAKIAVYTYDGSAEPHGVVAFDTAPDQVATSIKGIEKFESRDTSTDLNSTYSKALHDVQQHMGAAGVKLGAVVVVARGPDRAARVDPSKLGGRWGRADDGVDRFIVGVGQGTEKANLEDLATKPVVYVPNTAGVGTPLESIADQLDSRGRSLYLLAVCSAARAGTHDLTIRLKRSITNKEGKQEVQEGELSHTFDATGFGAGCEPAVTEPAEWKGTSQQALTSTPQEDTVTQSPSASARPKTGSGPNLRTESGSSHTAPVTPQPTATATTKGPNRKPPAGPDLRIEPAN